VAAAADRLKAFDTLSRRHRAGEAREELRRSRKLQDEFAARGNDGQIGSADPASGGRRPATLSPPSAAPPPPFLHGAADSHEIPRDLKTPA
jgi:hypothetical protein